MRAAVDLTGQRFGRLLILSRAPSIGGRAHWSCVCVCGTERVAREHKLLDGGVKSCGCLKREGQANFRHGHARKGNETPEYWAWAAMKGRCYRPSDSSFYNYGGRGITVCTRWLDGENGKSGFECFAADMGPRPEGRSLDRIDVRGNYEPTNCRWATRSEQMRNTRRVKLSEAKVAEIRALAGRESPREIARRFNISRCHVSGILLGNRWKELGRLPEEQGDQSCPR